MSKSTEHDGPGQWVPDPAQHPAYNSALAIAYRSGEYLPPIHAHADTWHRAMCRECNIRVAR